MIYFKNKVTKVMITVMIIGVILIPNVNSLQDEIEYNESQVNSRGYPINKYWPVARITGFIDIGSENDFSTLNLVFIKLFTRIEEGTILLDDQLVIRGWNGDNYIVDKLHKIDLSIGLIRGGPLRCPMSVPKFLWLELYIRFYGGASSGFVRPINWLYDVSLTDYGPIN
jgi:hypothetical protein